MHSEVAPDRLVTAAPSFDQVIADHLPMIRRIAAAHEANATARQDLIQDILYAVWRSLRSFRGEGSLRGFIARIATNRAVSHVQKALKLPELAEPPDDLEASEPGPEAYAVARDETGQLLRALRLLPIGLREPALLALEGLTQQEIASVLGITPNAVAIRMTRARSELRKAIGDK
jgi:RNA polymerase sigma factor (sigma-70 family)